MRLCILQRIQCWLVVAFVCFLMIGCFGGKWEDDPGNWARAFAFAKPDDVKVIHSYYWETGHWSAEYVFYFHIGANDDFKDKLIEDLDLALLDEEGSKLENKNYIGETPEWFVPNDLSSYDIYIDNDYDSSRLDYNVDSFRLYVDKESGDLFLYDGMM